MEATILGPNRVMTVIVQRIVGNVVLVESRPARIEAIRHAAVVLDELIRKDQLEGGVVAQGPGRASVGRSIGVDPARL
jgi:hypothetical protein